MPPKLHLLVLLGKRIDVILAGKIENGGNLFQWMKLEEPMARKYSKNTGNVFQIGGNKFYDRKNKIPMKILVGKRSGIGIIVEFRGILSGFSNQSLWFPPYLCRVCYRVLNWECFGVL
jgi:hypothetical protein